MTAVTTRQPTAEERVTTLVVGLGSADRGDDGVGPVVACRVAALALPGVEAVVHEDPTDLIELWSGRFLAVVVDALCSGAPAGTVQVLETGAEGTRLPDSARAETGRGGTHAFGLATAVELARALRRLPRRLVIVGVEASCFDHGALLSPNVEAAVPVAVTAVVEALGRADQEVGSDVPR
jgi:hydrogenase maturation protease